MRFFGKVFFLGGEIRHFFTPRNPEANSPALMVGQQVILAPLCHEALDDLVFWGWGE